MFKKKTRSDNPDVQRSKRHHPVNANGPAKPEKGITSPKVSFRQRLRLWRNNRNVLCDEICQLAQNLTLCIGVAIVVLERPSTLGRLCDTFWHLSKELAKILIEGIDSLLRNKIETIWWRVGTTYL